MTEESASTAHDDSKDKKTRGMSMEQRIEKMHTAFTNGKLPTILPHLEPVGYTAEKLDGNLAKVETLLQLNQQQQKEQSEQYAGTDSFNKKRGEIHDQYMKHRGLLKIYFEDNLQVFVQLGLNARVKKAYGDWLNIVLSFYTQLKNTPALLEEIPNAGVPATEVDAALAAVAALRALKEGQKKEVSEAQAATEARDKLFDELDPEYRKFIKYAKILLKDDQSLEALGIVVKR
ncbi:MAG TPA: hypothetical protein DDZ96_02820 [Porphyromonadaceae bacterium]|jgi:hypothetical protein|uniref:hypothetical protein n=1 Tax=Limibacterium fermenti TaxID=3229863 RepID=UPI000E82E280|nr:hypothetical protein [Porphyromonadaceae bacterium]HBK30971.1 hypothetical protein [Porphyromonadaceae bacterium]HBL32738.1 hypothetical protein [Porphyromonadaceae bacterium]